MANPVKGSDIYQDDGALDKLIKQLREADEIVKKMMDRLQQEAGAAAADLNKLNVATSENREQIGKSAKSVDEMERAYDAYTKAMEENQIKLQALKNSTQQMNTVNKLEARLLASKEGSYNRLSAQYGINKIALNQMTAAERAAGTEGEKLEKQTNAIYTEMKRLQEATGKHVLSVGDYGKATEGLTGKLQQVPGPAAAAGQAMEGLGTAMRFLLANPFVAILALIAGALYAVGKAFMRTEQGAKAMSRITGTISAAWTTMIKIAGSLGKSISDAFDDPETAVKSFGTAFKEQVVDQFNGFLDFMSGPGKALWKLVTGDLKGAADAAMDTGAAFIQMFTGMTGTEQKQAMEALAAEKAAFDKLQAAFVALEQARVSTRRSNRELERSLQSVTTEFELQSAAAGDGTKSFAVLEAAAEAAAKANERKAKLETAIARNNLNLINTEISLRAGAGEMVEDLYDQQLEAYKAVADAERQYTLAVRDNEQERAQIKQDKLEKDLDILIDGYDNQKTINEQLIADETLTFAQRREILEKTKQLSDDSFRAQVQTIQQFTGIAVDANALIAESDARVLNEKIRALGLSEIIEGRLLEIVRDRKSSNQDLAVSAKDLAKAEADAAAAAIKAAEDAKNAKISFFKEELDNELALKQSEFDLLQSTEAQKRIFSLNAEKERLQELIDINERLGGDLSTAQIRTMQNGIKKIDNELSKVSEKGSIWDSLGINAEGVQTVKDSFSQATAVLGQWAQERVDLTNTLVDNSKTEVEQAQAALLAQQENVRLGVAANVEGAQEQLDAAKQNQSKALEEQRRAQRAQIAIQAVEQASNLITASSKIWASLGFPLALPALGVLWGTFAASKIKALELTKKEFSSGGFEYLDYGGSHASGNDIHIGVGSDGSDLRAQRGESLAVFNDTATRSYDFLPALVGDINSGIFEKNWQRIGTAAGDSDLGVIFYGAATDTSVMERELRLLRKQGRDVVALDSDGKGVIRKGNKTTVYV